MKKYVILSFDDGRKDTWSNAIPIMERYGLTATLNITTDFIENPGNYHSFRSAQNKAMTVENILDAQREGFEIANHSAHHKNTVADINEASEKLKKWGIKGQVLGFASPCSDINLDNKREIEELMGKTIRYVRTGDQIRRKSILYKIGTVLQELTANATLFYLLNKEKFIEINNPGDFFYGVTITKKTTFKQIKKLISKMPQDKCVILMFHSILPEDEKGYGVDKWCWDMKEFDKLCGYLSDEKNIEIINTKDLCSCV